MASPVRPRAPVAAVAVPDGPRAYRRRLRRRGPLAALALPAVTGTLALLVWQLLSCGSGQACAVRNVTSLVLGLLALPTAVAFGLPLTTSASTLLAAVATSALTWLALGRWAARRATRSPVADWSDWRREFATIAVGLWVGLLGGLGVVVLVLARLE